MSNLRRDPGDIALNGVTYKLFSDGLLYAYQRSTEPKAELTAGGTVVAIAKSNQIEVTWDSFEDGLGDVRIVESKKSYHFSLGLFMERPNEAVVLPAAIPVENVDTTACSLAPSFVWEQKTEDGVLYAYVYQDRRSFRLSSVFTLIEEKQFEGDLAMTDGVVFNNIFYAAMGGDSNGGYIRTRQADGTWSRDDNTWKAIAGTNTSTPIRVTVTNHGYSHGDRVLIKGNTQDEANGFWFAALIDADNFDLYEDVAFTAPVASGGSAGTGGTVNRTDSNVKAEHLAMVGDLMVRTYQDPELGWATSRVDPIDSDPLIEANWTAGIGTIAVGDTSQRINSLVPVGDGEVLMTPSGVFVYSEDDGAYLNKALELEEHAHPDNGKGAFEWKGWVWIPTIIGMLRYRNEQIQDVTPGRFGNQSFETPVGPVSYLTGDVNRLIGVTTPFTINMNKRNLLGNTVFFAVSTAGAAPTNRTTETTDGDTTTGASLNGVTSSGYFAAGAKTKWHRLFCELLAKNTANVNIVSTQYYASDGTWKDFSLTQPVLDFTKGRSLPSEHPKTLAKTGDLILPSIPDDWALDTPTGFPAEAYWARFKTSGTIVDASVREIAIGPHIDSVSINRNADATKEVAIDHGGVAVVLTAKEDPGKGVVWQTSWGLGVKRAATGDGGAQPIGCINVIQPDNLKNAGSGQRWIFVGMDKVSYLLPLGNRPDPTLIVPTERDGVTNEIVLALPDHHCGMPNTLKVLEEIDATIEDADSIASLEVFYRVDGGNWVLAGTYPATSFPIKLTAGSEPIGKAFGVMFSITENSTATKLPRIRFPRMRVQPRPAMNDMISVTVELNPEQTMYGAIDRSMPSTGFAALEALATSNATVVLTDMNGEDRNVLVLQAIEKMVFNNDNEPSIVAEVTMVGL